MMIVYLVKSALCLMVFLMIHRLILQRESMHQFNRFFLLLAVVGSFLIPLITIEVAPEAKEQVQELSQVEIHTSDFSENSSPIEVSSAVSNDEIAEKPFDWQMLLWFIYDSVSVVFLIRFFRNINLLRDKINTNIHLQYKGETLILIEEESLPFSFFSYIFVSKKYFETEKLTDAIFAHEQAHVRGKHSWDILFIEAMLIPFWFHPGLYYARQVIKLNHEFIADQAALGTTPLEKYKSLLLSMMLPDQKFGLASSLNFSLTKKRFEMLRRRTANSTKWIKILSVIPVLAVLVYFFSEKVTAQAEREKNSEVVVNKDTASKENEIQILIRADGKIEVEGQIIEVVQLSELINSKNKEYTLARISGNSGVGMGHLADVQQVLRDLEIRKVVYEDERKQKEDLEDNVYTIVFGSYFQKLSKAEYYSQTKFMIKYPDGELEEFTYDNLPEKYKNNLANPPGPISQKVPSPELFESWKNGDKVALWLNGKVIPNSKLEEMKFNEIAYYTSSFVHSNARSERFPQNYQVSIYTLSGFENSYGKNSNFGKTPIGGTATFHSENPKNQKFTVNSYPVSLFQIDFIRYQEMLNTGAPFIEKSKTEQEQLVEMFSDLGGKYYSLRAEDKKKVEHPVNPHIPYYRLQNDEGVYYKLEKELSEEEKKQFSKTPPIFPYDKNIVTLSNYLKDFGKFQVKVNENRLFSQPSNQEIEELQSHFRSLASSYNSLPFEDKRIVQRPIFPFARLEKDGKVIFKRFEDLTEAERKEQKC